MLAKLPCVLVFVVLNPSSFTLTQGIWSANDSLKGVMNEKGLSRIEVAAINQRKSVSVLVSATFFKRSASSWQ
jgi:hypothetical protein